MIKMVFFKTSPKRLRRQGYIWFLRREKRAAQAAMPWVLSASAIVVAAIFLWVL
jgi:hypothetical protein